MRYSIEPCHPLGFWGRRMEREVTGGDFSSPLATVRFLKLNTLALIERSVDQGARSATRLLDSDDVAVVFLLDDLFASGDVMALMPPERVAEMIADTWKHRAGSTDLPTTCTVVSERSLTAAALAVVGDEDSAGQTASMVAKRYQGIKIEVPAQARTYVGDTVPSCPLLAAAWQLWRLGRLSQCDGQVRWWGTIPRTAPRGRCCSAQRP